MLQLDTRIPLGVQQLDLGAVQRNVLAAMQQRAAEQQMDQQNALAVAMQTYGQGVLSPDAGKRNASIAGLAAAGPAGFQTAMSLMQQEQQRLAPMSAEQAGAMGLRPGTVAMVNGLGVPQIVQRPDSMSAEAEAQRLRIARAQQTGGPESFSAPQEVMQNGQRVLVQFGNRGSVRPVAGGYQAGPPQTSLVPLPGYGPNGEPVVLFPNGRGGLVQGSTPEGVSIAPRTREINTGTEILTVEPGGNIVARRLVDIRGRASEQIIGQREGTDLAGAADAIRTAETTLRQIDGVLNHRALELGTGLQGRLLNRIPGTPVFDFAQRVEQIQGQAFLQAFESLRGGGAITDIDAQKATQAIARLNTAASPSDFRIALGELRDIVQAGRDRARNLVSGPTAPASSPLPTAEPPPGPAPAPMRIPPPSRIPPLPPGFELVR